MRCSLGYFHFNRKGNSMITFIWYPKCSTCKKAKDWLEKNHITYKERHIVENHPNLEELRLWYSSNLYELKKYFNTSGNLYKEMNLKEKLPKMSEEEQLKLLSTNGMLVRRPIIISKKGILIGFKEKEWTEFFSK